MKVHSLNEDKAFSDQKKIITKMIVEASFSKEIRILMNNGQLMKQQQASSPIIVHLLSSQVDFGVSGEIHALSAGSIIALDANVTHDLKASQDSEVRLTLAKRDTAERVKEVSQ